jgi:hypothetical protein
MSSMDCSVMPRLLYGLEITTLRHNEIQKLEIYFKKLLKQVQNLPERTANEATYLMMLKSFQYLDV